MTLGFDRPSLVPTLIIPDEQTWTVLGHDPAEFGAVPSFRAGATASLLAPNRIPAQLGDSLTTYLSELSGSESAKLLDLAIPGSLCTGVLLERQNPPESVEATGIDHESVGHSRMAEENAGSHEMGHGSGHGEMDDMMAIVGEPSADGLVMETTEVSYGPLAVPFPGGLTIKATLDGDVVASAGVSGLRAVVIPAGEIPPAPDPMSPVAWKNSIDLAGGRDRPQNSRVFRVELERAISHLAWLRSLSRLLGWRRMTRRTAAVLAELARVDVGASFDDEAANGAEAHLDAAARAMVKVLDPVRDSRTMRWRLAGHGIVTSDRAADAGLDGPNTRASGLHVDRRIEDPHYSSLGFKPLLEQEGDAAARTRLRAREAAQSIELARTALAAQSSEPSGFDSPSSGIEGPRGALVAECSNAIWRLRTPGAAAAHLLAAEAMVGESWEDALAVLASFDLTPWAGEA